jgi:hypothetical protein
MMDDIALDKDQSETLENLKQENADLVNEISSLQVTNEQSEVDFLSLQE